MFQLPRRASGGSSLRRISRGAALLLIVLFAGGLGGGIAQAQTTIPPIPDPVAVTVDPSHTAFLMLDFASPPCENIPACQDSLVPMASLLGRAREAGALVIFTRPNSPGASVEEMVAPLPDELVIVKPRLEDGFDLMQDTLQAHGIDTLILTGVSAPLAMYAAWDAAGYGYTVVVLEDGIPSRVPAMVAITEYMSLNQPVANNPDNTPLKKGSATLSRSDLISFQ